MSIEKEKVARLTQGAIRYIKRHQKDEGYGISLFPSWLESGVPAIYNGRLAWCYGDIGIGKAHEWASEVLVEEALKKDAKEILLIKSKLRNPDITLVNDAGYCHGSFGNAHIFYQLWKKYGNTMYQEAADFWLEDGFSRRFDDDKKPYQQWDSRDRLWHFDLNLLEGISGIGLTIIDFLSEKENTWDECLMLR